MMKWISVFGLIALFGISFAFGKEPKQMGQEAYSQARSIKVCSTAEGHVIKCGTGIFIERNKVLTAFHVVSPLQVQDGPATTRTLEMNVMVLRENSEEFEHAVILSSAPAYDIAVLVVKGTAPQAILHSGFFRGQTVWAVGNPEGRDFRVVETYVSGVQPIEFPGLGILELISVDAKDNRITHGFSGGGLFTDKGMIGMIQLCSDQSSTCLALPTEVIEKHLKGTK